MKKFLTAAVAGATLMSAGAAFAANQVQMTLTSPTIIKSGCEKAGSVTFAFDQNSVLKKGDWWYMDLPVNVTLCKDVDYLIGGDINNALSKAITMSADGTNLNFADANDNIPAAITAASTGPLTATKIDAGAVATQGYCIQKQAGGAAASQNLAIRVKGISGTRRVTLTVLGGGVGNYGAALPASQIFVNTGWKMNIKILDGQSYNGLAAPNGPGATTTSIYPNTNGLDSASGTYIYHELGAAGVADDELLRGNVPVLGNTLCINASAMAGDLVFVSFASLNDKFTFTGDSQIAHVGSAASISLKNCKSSDLDQIQIAAQSSCSFTYLRTNTYACPTGTLKNDNLIIQTASAFGDLGDKYDIKAESLTNGVYFGADPALSTYDLVINTDMCAAGSAIATSFYKYKGDVTSGISYDSGATCAVASTKQVNMVKTIGGSLNLDNKNGLRVDLPLMVYDRSVIANGSEAKVKLTLSKYPCGDIFEGSATLGTFVTTCSSASTPGGGVTTSTLMFPFFPPMDPAAAPGWWGGYIIVNGSTAAGTAALTYTDAAGATMKYTTPSLAAGAQFNGSTVTYSMLTAGTGTFDKTKNYSINAACNFGSAAGFAFVSGPGAAASYTAYTNSGSAWQ